MEAVNYDLTVLISNIFLVSFKLLNHCTIKGFLPISAFSQVKSSEIFSNWAIIINSPHKIPYRFLLVSKTERESVPNFYLTYCFLAGLRALTRWG